MFDHRKSLLNRIAEELKAFEASHGEGETVQAVLGFKMSDGDYEFAWTGDNFLLTNSHAKAEKHATSSHD